MKRNSLKGPCDDPTCTGCVEWRKLPTEDVGQGVCEWCGRAITDSHPAVASQEGDDLVMHFAFCPFVEDGFPHRIVA